MPKRKRRKRRTKSLADQLRAAIDETGRTAYSIAKEAGTTPEVVSRFLTGTDVRISTAGKIAEVLGLELQPKAD